jgi:hypothetical protein
MPAWRFRPAVGGFFAGLGTVRSGSRRRRLPGSGGLEQADLPHREHLALAWPFGVEGDLGVGEPPDVDAAVLVGVAVLGEGVVVDVGGGTLDSTYLIATTIESGPTRCST